MDSRVSGQCLYTIQWCHCLYVSYYKLIVDYVWVPYLVDLVSLHR